MQITRLEGKFKLSQNRSHEDQLSVIENLEKSEQQIDRDVALLMRDKL